MLKNQTHRQFSNQTGTGVPEFFRPDPFAIEKTQEGDRVVGTRGVCRKSRSGQIQMGPTRYGRFDGVSSGNGADSQGW